jgi:hypothetical protein
VIRRHLLAAIASGVQAGDDDVARAALRRIDWILRGRARRKLEDALIDATLATNVSIASDPEATRHVLRAAALLVQRRSDVELADPEQVTQAYNGLSVATPSRVPIASIVAGMLVLTMATAAAATVMGASEPAPAASSFVRPSPPAAIGAYRDGGVPVRDPAIEAALVGRVAEPPALSSHPAVATAWRGMIESLARFDAVTDDPFHEATGDLRAHVQAVSDQLAAAGLGYFLDLEVASTRGATIAAYRVDKVTFVRAGSDRVRVLDLRRLGAEASRPLLGMKPEGMNDPVAMLDQIDEHVKTQLVPVLQGAPYTLTDDAWARTSRGRAAASAAGQAIRRELAAAGADGGAASRPPAAGSLSGIGTGALERAHTRIGKLVLASVRHHEAQHGIEQEHVPDHPAVLAAFVGPVRDSNGRTNAMAVRSRNELSAYASQIASDMWLPQVALWNMSRHAFRSSRRGSPESYAAVIIIEGLARQLDVPSRGPVFHGGEIDRDRLAALVGPLAAKPTIELRSAAARLWAELFGEPLVRLVDDVFGE